MEIFNTPDSSNIKRIGHNGKVLVVTFKNGDEWEYDAPKSVFAEMKKAKSVGSFLHARVKGIYNGRKRD
jgi:hypothetical protein